MPKPNQNKNAQRKAASAMFALQHLLHDEIRLKEVAEKSSVDFDRVAQALREMGGKKDISVQLLKDSWDLIRVLLAEACELRDRAMILYIIEEVIKRKEPKQQHVKTEGVVDHRVLLLVKTIEDQEIEQLIARRTAITVGGGKARPVRAIPDRRGSGEKRS